MFFFNVDFDMDIFGYEAQYIVRVHFIKKRTKWKHEW